MFNFFKNKKSDSKDSANDVPQNDSKKPDADETNSKSAQNEDNISESLSNNLESSKPPSEDERKTVSHSFDDADSKVSAEDAESASVEGKHSETIMDDDQDKTESEPVCIRCNSSLIDNSSTAAVGNAEKSFTTQTHRTPTRLEDTYTFDEAIELAGYGKFQKILTLFVGLSWFADVFEILIVVIIDNYLGCDWTIDMWQNALLSTNMFIGMMVGGPVFGMVADKYGRRRAVSISMLFAFLFGAMCSASPNIWYMLSFRTLVGFTMGNLSQGLILCVEYYPVKYRGMAGFFINYYWSIGNILLIVLCWTMMETIYMWRRLLFIVSLPSLAAFISTSWYPESVRYYLVTNQYDKAVEQLRQLADVNCAELPLGSLNKEVVQETKGNLLDLLRAPHTLTTLLFWYIWFAVAVHYYGIAFMTPLIIQEGKVFLPAQQLRHNSTTIEFFMTNVKCKNMTTANYFDLMWTGSAEIPGMWFFSIMVQYAQRKRLLGVAIFVNSILLSFLLVDFKSNIPGRILLYILRANSGGIFQLSMIMTSEAFPTTLRATSMGSCHAFSMIGAAIVPFLAQVLVINEPIWTVSTMSGVVLVASLATFLLPREMKDIRMKDFSDDYKQVEKETLSVLRNAI